MRAFFTQMTQARLGRAICAILLGLLLAAFLRGGDARAKEVIPPPPKAFFNDYAGVTRPDTARRLNQELQQFERDTSNQIVVAVYPTMQTDSSIEDYTVRIAQSWHVGQKGRDNGAVLFVFVQERKMYIQVGYGLEGALTDYLCHQIIANEIRPHFKAGDYDAGLTAGVHAMIAATKGEYKGTGRTVADRQREEGGKLPWWAVIFLVLVIYFVIFQGLRNLNWTDRGGGGGGPFIFTGGGGSSFGGGGGGSGGFSDGGGGGGFSGGGGSFGGGGAGGDW